MASATKTCFVIAPIGTEGSKERIRSDQVLKYIIAPAAKDCGYETIRADHISEPGLITSQVIVVDDPLVIADLTGRNPNVFYELAIRHSIKKPIVQLIDSAETIPFDVASTRTVQVDHHDLDSAARAKEEIIRQIRAVEKNPADVDTPISVAVELQFLKKSDNPIENANAEIMILLNGLFQMMNKMQSEMVAFRRMQHFYEPEGRNAEYDSDFDVTVDQPPKVINLMEALKRSLAAEELRRTEPKRQVPPKKAPSSRPKIRPKPPKPNEGDSGSPDT
jgi:hypothetical protein